jgi:periplasmic protein TonB
MKARLRKRLHKKEAPSSQGITGFQKALAVSVVAHLVLFGVMEFTPDSKAQDGEKDSSFVVVLEEPGSGRVTQAASPVSSETRREKEPEPEQKQETPPPEDFEDTVENPAEESAGTVTREETGEQEPAGTVKTGQRQREPAPADGAAPETDRAASVSRSDGAVREVVHPGRETGGPADGPVTEGPVTEGPEMEKVLADLYRLMKDRLVYPMAARRRNMEGVVTVRVYIEADGTLGSHEVSGTSGYTVLDKAALETLEKVFPIAHRTGRPLLLTIQIEYSLI